MRKAAFAGLLLYLLLAAATCTAAEPTPASLMELRRHTELAMARGDYRSAEMLIETYLPAAQRLADPTWQVFNGYLIAARVKLALAKPDEAERQARRGRAPRRRVARHRCQGHPQRRHDGAGNRRNHHRAGAAATGAQ